MLFNGFKSCDMCMINRQAIYNAYALSLFFLQQSFCIFCALANVHPYINRSIVFVLGRRLAKAR